MGGKLLGTEKKDSNDPVERARAKGKQSELIQRGDLGSCLTVRRDRGVRESTDVQGVWARWLIRQQFPPEVKGCRWNPSRKGKDPSPEIK